MGILASKSFSRQSQSLLVFSMYSKAVHYWPGTASHRHLNSCTSRWTLGCWEKLCSSFATTTQLILPSLKPRGACRHRPSIPPSLIPHIHPFPHTHVWGHGHTVPSPLQACSLPFLGQERLEGEQVVLLPSRMELSSKTSHWEHEGQCEHSLFTSDASLPSLSAVSHQPR